MVFFLGKGLNKRSEVGKKKEKAEEAQKDPEPTKEELLLTEIRDLLKKKIHPFCFPETQKGFGEVFNIQTTEHRKSRKSFKKTDFLQEWFDKLGDTAYNKYNGSEWGKDRVPALSAVPLGFQREEIQNSIKDGLGYV